jgi:hypothetical protein
VLELEAGFAVFGREGGGRRGTALQGEEELGRRDHPVDLADLAEGRGAGLLGILAPLDGLGPWVRLGFPLSGCCAVLLTVP